MIFAAKNKKMIHRVWAAVSLIAILGMIGFMIVPFLK